MKREPSNRMKVKKEIETVEGEKERTRGGNRERDTNRKREREEKANIKGNKTQIMKRLKE